MGTVKNFLKSTNKYDGSLLEIERKLLMEGFPTTGLELLSESLIHQAYLSVEPEVRITRETFNNKRTKYMLTIKGKGDLVRTEVENEISCEQYYELMKIIGKEPIEKLYRQYRLEDRNILQISQVDGTYIYAEVEFDSEEEAIIWQPSSDIKHLVIRDITDEESYKMKNYWARHRL